MDLYKHIGINAHKIAWRVFKWTGINLHQCHAVLQAVQNNWVRPFDRLPLKGVGAEIGVYRGIHAYNLLKRHPGITKLYLCDGYEPYGEVSGEVALLRDAMSSSRQLLAGKPVEFIYRNSPGCAESIPDDSLDFCYIDGAHDRQSVHDDLVAMWSKVKKGGIIGGHDCSVKFNGVINGVIDAVSTLSIGLGASINEIHVETPDWWITKV